MANEKIKKDVVDNLYWDSRIDASDIKVQVDRGGKVKLKGTVPSYTAKTSATTCAWDVNGVTRVVNELGVEYPTALKVPSDTDIKSNVESALLWSADIDSTKIDVSVDDNEVTLEGTVDAYWKKYRAETLSDLSGVHSIVNKLAVVPTEDIADEQIAEDVINALTRNVNVDPEKIEVKVKNGKVTLNGEVTSWNTFRAAERSTYFTSGVKDVDNLISIEY
ncbi:BON domain-containing protein [Candidatus Dojkabacteria bacterium]|nr:BON domain-containing protein [Candidatus Dojkabacteria bacterium]